MGEHSYKGLKEQVNNLENVIADQSWEIQKLQVT